VGLDGVFAGLAGADADGEFTVHDEDFSITDFTGLAALGDRFDDLRNRLIGDDEFEVSLGQEIDHVFAATVDFGVTLLAAEAFDLADGHAFDADGGEGLTDFVELVGFDDGFNEFHNEVAEVNRDGRRLRRVPLGRGRCAQLLLQPAIQRWP